jgi:hypothetical protein
MVSIASKSRGMFYWPMGGNTEKVSEENRKMGK